MCEPDCLQLATVADGLGMGDFLKLLAAVQLGPKFESNVRTYLVPPVDSLNTGAKQQGIDSIWDAVSEQHRGQL